MTDPPNRVPVPSLLESLNRDHLDPGYAEAARRKATRGHAPDPRGKRNATLVAVGALLVVGILFGISAVNTEVNAPRTEKARSGLLEDIDRAQQRQSVLASSAAELAERLRSTQAGLGAAGPLQTVSVLENAGQVTPVTGPGLRIVIDEAPADDSGGGGVILDRDVQLLVNDLWSAGAEAISIGGVRLQPRSAIRQAGGSILVDNKPVFWPITIDAIGDPADLQVNAVGLPGFGRFSSFAQLYDIEFDVSAQQELTLPGGSGGALLYARPPPGTGSTIPAPTTTASTTSSTTTSTTTASTTPVPGASTGPTG
ncbi:DUF881 domain-containing protein [Nakamurella sp. GG22]